MKTELVVRARCSASSTTAWAFGENSWLFELSAIGLQGRDSFSVFPAVVQFSWSRVARLDSLVTGRDREASIEISLHWRRKFTFGKPWLPAQLLVYRRDVIRLLSTKGVSLGLHSRVLLLLRLPKVHQGIPDSQTFLRTTHEFLLCPFQIICTTQWCHYDYLRSHSLRQNWHMSSLKENMRRWGWVSKWQH